MDELEISGKRYISTRRAGKDYKYHSDYIGQLIRAKKVVGQKVGRSWYVDAESLAAYFNNPQVPTREPEVVVEMETPKVEVAVPQVVEEVVETKIEVPVQIVEEEKIVVASVEVKKEIEENFVSEIVEEEEPVSHSMHIPIRRASFAEPIKKSSGLTYVEEDAQTFPEIKKAHAVNAKFVATPFIKDIVQGQEEEREISQEKILSQNKTLMPILGVTFIGIVVFVAVAAGSVLVSSNLIIEAGKPASVEYSFR